MIRTTLSTVAGVLAVAAILATSASGAPRTSWTMVFDARQTATHFVDNAPNGESPGDAISFTDILLQHGKVAGFAEATGTLVDRKRDANELQGTFDLPGGQIMIGGISLGQAATQSFAIVGGTGRYDGVRGTARIRTGAHGMTIVLRAHV
jgi:hypothetical protein